MRAAFILLIFAAIVATGTIVMSDATPPAPGTGSTTGSTTGTTAGAQPPELGRVRWLRELDDGVTESRRTGRPVLLLFQEIPGCQGCVDYGAAPLSHPLLVEAMETSFVPVAIYNNRPGRDEEVRTQFDEPAWNYPVMRFLGTDGDLIPRKDQVFESGEVAKRMIAALEAAERPVPGYLRNLAAELAPGDVRQATFAMHCYWDGEAKLGSIDGVLATRAGWHEGNEVVEVTYDATRVPYRTLLESASEMQCASTVYTHDDDQAAAASGLHSKPIKERPRDARASDQKFALGRTAATHLPMTPMQASRVNAALRLGKDVETWLSPRQQALLKSIESVLAADSNALAGLDRPPDRPNDPRKLGAYEDALRTKLSAAEG